MVREPVEDEPELPDVQVTKIGDHVLYCKSSEDMSDIAGNSIDAIITSPPYWINSGGGLPQFGDDKPSSYEQVLDLLRNVSGECLRILKPGGVFIWSMGTVLKNGKHYPLAFELMSEWVNSGFVFRDYLFAVWRESADRRAAHFLSTRRPDRYYPTIMHDIVWILTKDGAEWKRDSTPVPEGMDVPKTVMWPTPFRKTKEHGGQFDEKFANMILTLYTKPGDTVLDPFAGVGILGEAAARLGRRFIGIDNEPNYIKLATERLTRAVS